MAQDIGILAFLTAHRDAQVDVGKVDGRMMKAWLADMDAKTREGIRRAWLVGRALSAEREGLKRGDVKRWEEARAEELGRKVRTLQAYRYLAESLADQKIAVSLRLSHTGGGLEGLLRAIRKEKKKLDGGESVAAVDKVVAWRRRAKRLLEAVPEGREGVVVLREPLGAVELVLGGWSTAYQRGMVCRGIQWRWA